jgi:hypothetical protein
VNRARWTLFPVAFAAVHAVGWSIYVWPKCSRYLASHPDATSCAYQGGYVVGIVSVSSLAALALVAIRAFMPRSSSSWSQVLCSGALAAVVAVAIQVAGFEWRFPIPIAILLLGATAIGCILALITGFFANGRGAPPNTSLERTREG